jgi:hypothetical protein
MKVYVDGTLLITKPVSLPASGLLGFSAGTGGLNNRHAVANVVVKLGGGTTQPSLQASPSSLAFSVTAGGADPAAKTVSVTSSGADVPVAASADASWLSVSPASGTTPQDLSVAVRTAGLAAGTYTGTVTITSTGAGNSPVRVPVTLTVAAKPTLAVTPTSLSFSATAGGASPAAKTLSVANGGGGTLAFTAAASAGAPWLSVTPGSGTAPRDVSVAVNSAGLAAGTYTGTVRVSASGADGSPKDVAVTLTVNPASGGGGGGANGLVGAWSFDEASGATVADASGAGNAGTITGATRVAGKYGGALSFNGSSDLVRVPDAASLHLGSALTMEAWVRPTALGSVWRTVLMKQRGTNLGYALYGNDNGTLPTAHLFTTSDLGTRGTSALPLDTWSFLAATWDGTTARLYVNGTEVASRAVGGTIASTADPLTMGGNGVWGEWFQGQLDNVRLYNRALSASEVQGDMTTPVG